jgi:hypothetical protein
MASASEQIGLIDAFYKTPVNKIRTNKILILEFSILQKNNKEKLNSKYPFDKNKFWKGSSLFSLKTVQSISR